MDPPDHERLHRLIVQAFPAKQVGRVRGSVVRIVDGLLDEIASAGPGPVDLMAGLCWPLSIAGITELLGVPAADRAVFAHWANLATVVGPDQQQESRRAAEELWAYFVALIAERRQ